MKIKILFCISLVLGFINSHAQTSNITTNKDAVLKTFTNSNNTSSVSNQNLLNTLINTDSDGDGILDEFDLDSDNDGILDIDEDCFGFRAQQTTGTWLGTTTSTVTVNYGSGSYTQNNINTIHNKKVKFHINTNGAGLRHAKSGNVTMSFTFNPAVKASEIGFMFEDLDGQNNSSTASFTFRINNSQPNNILRAQVITPTLQGDSPNNYNNFNNQYNSTTGVYTSAGLIENQNLFLKGYGETLVSSFTITGTNIGSGDLIAYALFGYKICDTDNDGIPNIYDTDSDNDGCPDAIEGAGNILEKQLDTNNRIASTINTTGIPNLANGGQAIGSSENAAVNACICNKAANATGTALAANVGISTVAKDNDWPEKIKGAHIALESRSKGLVVTRVENTTDLNNITSPIEGMVVYDKQADCLKIYSKNMNSQTYSWKCFEKQTCPDN